MDKMDGSTWEPVILKALTAYLGDEVLATTLLQSYKEYLQHER